MNGLSRLAYETVFTKNLSDRQGLELEVTGTYEAHNKVLPHYWSASNTHPLLCTTESIINLDYICSVYKTLHICLFVCFPGVKTHCGCIFIAR
jgi:hypothetical protein